MTWECFPYYWPFVRGIHQSLVDSVKKINCVIISLRLTPSCRRNSWFSGDLRIHDNHVMGSMYYQNHMLLILCRELLCITVKWTWYNGRDIFFHITSGRINTWKGVNQLKELFFLNLIFFLNIYLKLTNHRYFMIKNPLFFTIHNKNGVLL